MRVTVFGKQYVATAKSREFVAVNLGMSNFTEHVVGLHDFIQLQNFRTNRRKLAKNMKAVGRWAYTPFADSMLFPDCNYLTREIIIDNSSIRKDYNVFLLEDGNYSYIQISRGISPTVWRDTYGSKRKFAENDFFLMDDYQNIVGASSIFPSGFTTSRNGTTTVDKEFAASWAVDGLFILVNKDLCDCDIVGGIEKALKQGSLAVVRNEPRLFTSNGLCLIDLDMAYNPLGRLM